MNLNHEQESEFERRLRELPADDDGRPEHRDAVRDQALAAFDRALQTRPSTRWKRVLLLGRDVMKRPIPRYVAAACFLAAVVWLLLPGTNTAAAALERMIDAVVSARSARFHTEIKVEGQPKQTANVTFLAPAKYRMEMDKAVNISDFAVGKILSLMPDQKLAVVFNLKNMPKDAKSMEQMNHFERLRQLFRERDKLPAYERLGAKTFDGRKALGFRLESGISTLILWGDARTGQPIRIEDIYSGVPHTETVMTQFEMDVEVKAEQFALDVPQGYKVQSFDIEASKPQERDFVDSLRACAELGGGAFPDALDTQSVTKLMIGAILSGNKEGKGQEPDGQELMKHAMKIGRGFQFALGLPASAKAHYAGKGVKLDAKDRPIFWYVPEGSTRYRVIDATLAARAADEAPQIEGAVPLAKKPAAETPK